MINRAVPGWTFILSGWLFYLTALVCPAIEFGTLGLDGGYGRETKSGARCFADTFDPRNWLFAPLLVGYACANVLMIGSVLVFLSPAILRLILGGFFLFGFCLTLTTPLCSYVHGISLGCILWIFSYLAVGIGCLLLPGSKEAVIIE